MDPIPYVGLRGGEETRNRGFTLIELLVVIAVLAVLAAGVMVAINPGKRIRQANDAKIRNDVGQIATALQAYFTWNQLYPAALADLATSQDLKMVPVPPGGGSYNYARSGTCTTLSCECRVYFALQDPAAANNVWCWRSSQGSASQVAPAACTAP